ncbi:MAG: hypothetical protein R3E68_04590 [Burkholderiaceae bacterium]
MHLHSSGLEASEAAIKLARLYGHNREIDLPRSSSTRGPSRPNAGHVVGHRQCQGQKGFEPLVTGFVRTPLNSDLADLQRIAAERPNVVAVFLEGIRARAASARPASVPAGGAGFSATRRRAGC